MQQVVVGLVRRQHGEPGAGGGAHRPGLVPQETLAQRRPGEAEQQEGRQPLQQAVAPARRGRRAAHAGRTFGPGSTGRPEAPAELVVEPAETRESAAERHQELRGAAGRPQQVVEVFDPPVAEEAGQA